MTDEALLQELQRGGSIKNLCDFLVNANTWPLGKLVANAAGTAIGEEQNFVESADEDGQNQILQLMQKVWAQGPGIQAPTETDAQIVYDAVKTFMQNTQFSFLPGKKYWSNKPIFFEWAT